MDLSEQLFLQDLSDNMESCILDKSVSMLRSASNFQVKRTNMVSPHKGDPRKPTAFAQRMASENELPIFDGQGTDFTIKIKQRTAQNSIRDMRYSQRNYGYTQRAREFGNFNNRFGQDPNENVFSSSNSHLNDNLRFLNRKRGNSRPKTVQSPGGLPIKQKNLRARSKTPKKLGKLPRDSDSESQKNKGDRDSNQHSEANQPRRLSRLNSASSPKLETQFFSKKVENEVLLNQMQKQNIERIMDPKKQKRDDLRKFQDKLAGEGGQIEALMDNTIPQKSTSKRDVDSKTFFQETIEQPEGLKFETPVFDPKSAGLFDFDMDVENLRQEDIFFKEKQSNGPKLDSNAQSGLPSSSLSLFDRFLLIGGDKSQIPDFKLTNTVCLQPLCAYSTAENKFLTNPICTSKLEEADEGLWADIESETKTLLKFAMPFEVKLRHERIENKMEKLNQILLRDDSTNDGTEFFCIAFNPPENEAETWGDIHMAEANGLGDLSMLGENRIDLSHNESFMVSRMEIMGHTKEPTHIGERMKMMLDLRKQIALLSRSNPNSFNFFFCLRYNDVFVQPSNSGMSLDLFYVPRIFAFRSKFPLSVFYHDLLKKLLSRLRRIRISNYMEAVQGLGSTQKIAESFLNPNPMPENYQSNASVGNSSLQSQTNPHQLAVDSVIESLSNKTLFVTMSTEFLQICQTLLAENKVLVPPNTISLNLESFSISYTLPSLVNSHILEAQFGFRHFLSKLPFEEFIIFLTAILLEKTIVLVSENINSLCSAIATLNTLIRPFRWSFPIIYSLPKECMLMLEAPVPVLIGLNVSSHTFLKDIAPVHFKDIKQNKDKIFLLLDDHMTMASKPLLNSLHIPYFNDFLIVLKVIYKKNFMEKDSYFYKISKKKASGGLRKYSLSKTSNYTYNDRLSKIKKYPASESSSSSEQKLPNMAFKNNDVPELFEYIRSTFTKNIINHLPRLEQAQAETDSQVFVTELKPEKFSSNPFDQVFLKQFFSTQAFHFYFENQYPLRFK